MRTRVQSLASLSALKTQHCHELRYIGHRHSLEPVLLWLWCRAAAIAPIWPLAWEFPYAMGAALKRQKKKCVGTNNESFTYKFQARMAGHIPQRRSQALAENALFFFVFLFFFRDTITAYGGSQARGWIRAVATGLCHSHSKARSCVFDLHHSSGQCRIPGPLS